MLGFTFVQPNLQALLLGEIIFPLPFHLFPIPYSLYYLSVL